ncbi:MAG: Acetyl esterase [Friedmanniella sp.]|nr:Acetyl esterase [Friedmanniella sp.]
MAALQRLPRPDPPSARYLSRTRRELPRWAARTVLGPVVSGVRLEDVGVPAADGTTLRVRLYRSGPPAARPRALVVNFHGGGFVFGNLTASDWLCGNLAGRAQVVVASVDYRLAPEHPAPVPFQDSWAATRWLIAHADELGADPARVSVMGESAGGNLAALVALASRDETRRDPTWPVLQRQILLYPATDLSLASPSVGELPDAPMLRRSTLDWYGRLYLPQDRPDSIRADDPRVSPLHHHDHGDLPPALVVAAGQDPIRDDAYRYADALRAAGVPVELSTHPDAIHGFVSIPLFEAAAHLALDQVVAAVLSTPAR